ncbi:outer membrane protein assembly factor BamA [Pedobacter boryungensis]|uniref:Outer membrane protein assembly factor BamA n=1 Tax=Pedobacter boryungensis TaxID=869962 RepID=A0ABX2DEA2_9SPHI|nr:outer membrane protein assembly factor BamA [Pedobacter boryungensis]NQX32414.1 outer membrane protein assembly factor BamA [Pedobacter boryungensis]
MKRIYQLIFLLLIGLPSLAQIRTQPAPAAPSLKVQGLNIDYFSPKEYVIGGTTLTGTQYLDKEVIITLSKLTKGERIILPGEATSNAIKNLWVQGLFDDVQLFVTKIEADTVYFDIEVVERPRLSSFEFIGVSKSQKTDISEKLADKAGKTIINDNLYNTTRSIINKYLLDKGYFYTTIDFKSKPDPNQENSVILQVLINKGKRVKVHEITFTGNKDFKSSKLRKYLKKTKQQAFYKVFGSGKFNKEKYEEDKLKLVAKMQEKGYRDAAILKDSIYKYNDKSIGIKLDIYEGPKYYFGNISWVGNAKYTTEYLEKVLGIEKGELFSEEKLEKKLRGSANGDDVSSVYLNDGYLTFNIDPVQTKIHNDTVDVEMRIYEGPQYTNNKISIEGNTITNDRVVLREIRTKPGEKFSKELLVRTVREIGALGNFDESKTNPVPKPNPADGTVDIVYHVEEKPSDQIELSGGFGGGRVIGTLGLTFNNFSLRNLFKGEAYKPLPKGDGQKLSLRGQTNGKYYQSYSFSFSEPWFGGKKPISFGLSAFTSLQSNSLAATDANYQKIRLNGVSISLGRKLKWPDNWFSLVHSVNLNQYILNNYPGYLFSTGTSYNLNLTQEIARDSRNGSQIFPTGGSYIKFTIQATPPYSLLNNVNYKIASDKLRYKFTEYHKWKFEAQWFETLIGKLVFKGQAQFGFLGTYNSAVGESAFERFKLGGDGMQGFDFLQGSELIAMRGYSNNSVIPVGSNPTIAQSSGSPIFNKYVMELRYPVISSQQATAFMTVFAEGGNTWNKFSDFNPFNVRRSVGVGAKIFLPIFGLLGIDYGYGFDKIPGIPDANKGQFHFSIAQQLGGFN